MRPKLVNLTSSVEEASNLHSSWSWRIMSVRTRRALMSTWRTDAPVGAWVSSVSQANAEDYGAGAPRRAEELLLIVLIPV